MAESETVGSRRFALIVQLVIALTGVAMVAANVVLTNRALNLDEKANDEQKQVVMVYATLAGSSAQPAPKQPGQTVIKIDYALQNVGDRPIRGCGTYYEPVTEDLTPSKYWPSIMEPGGIMWTLDPGVNHETIDDVTFDRGQEGDTMIVELWFECVYPKVVSESTFLRLNLATPAATIANDLNRRKPLDSWDRYSAIERADGRTPHPRPAN